MNTERSIAIMKALADQSRLAIINSLLEQPQYVEEIASRHALAQSTVSFHLRKLEQAGLVTRMKEQYYAMFQAKEEIFATTLRELVSAPPAGKELQDGRISEYRRKILETFFRGGKLVQLPAQKKKRLVILDKFAQMFTPGRRYSEQEVTALIAPLYQDYCTIRRLMVDEGLIMRDQSGYWRAEEMAGAKTVSSPVIGEKECDSRGEAVMVQERGFLKQAFKQLQLEMGVYQLQNRITGRIYIGTSRNLEGSRNGRMFELRTGKAVFNRELQKDLDQYGAESFEFSVLSIMDAPEPGDNIKECLAALERHWLDKLQPYGERGYHKHK
jgi:DNA-binding HxlR family transcriptional regulator